MSHACGKVAQVPYPYHVQPLVVLCRPLIAERARTVCSVLEWLPGLQLHALHRRGGGELRAGAGGGAAGAAAAGQPAGARHRVSRLSTACVLRMGVHVLDQCLDAWQIIKCSSSLHGFVRSGG